ncbi:glycerol-3-phosphate cytidylyltransferase [Paucilactobacillus oligofermentans DSM 15707 = LMG 22743]|uniref:Glycerol-3-phosphate cytidylyltransferase n=1 Tax=Paucilactobacillus oligofermentans DSM 15707 = LMG 22743 TaxID=1423778 RepID=A0A0R1RDQ0_9LACO|nr:glycerol-3-phosphate cytidylyltransferase [Paucilactobacillus oligofermentans]KRL55103.1 glycerol-3-phosphate cytidylyltransferase [Paucilactobacillus oligofermentans DSM 15707 = LMG 22743]CUS25909.1 Glycerol-3-phosphate cytidylyltransferase [Paucilactobacillus oligofermentans DSM 15707 = LMG 22743]
MKTVLTYGTFDLLHKGHVKILERAASMGDRLIVGLSTDEFNINQKGKRAYTNFEDRKYMLEAIKYVDLVIPENNWNQKIHDIQKYDVDIFVIGNDWAGKFDNLKEYVDVIYLERTDGISTTQIKHDLSE